MDVMLVLKKITFTCCLCLMSVGVQAQELAVHKDTVRKYLLGQIWFHLSHQSNVDYTTIDTFKLRMNRECIQASEYQNVTGSVDVVFDKKTVKFTDCLSNGISSVRRQYISNSNVYGYKLKERKGKLLIIMNSPVFSGKTIWRVQKFVIDKGCSTRPQMTLVLVKEASR